MEKNRDSSIGRIPPLPGSVCSHSLVGSTSPGEKESSEGLVIAIDLHFHETRARVCTLG